MGLASTMLHVKNLLDNAKVPGNAGNLNAVIQPYDPNTSTVRPTAYIWDARGGERRISGPRSKPPPNNQGQYAPIMPAGWKMQNHSIEIFLVWFDNNSDPQADTAFPWVVDVVMNILRTCQMPMTTTDPGTNLETQLNDLGKNMSWEYVPVKSVTGQRLQRFDALVTAPVEEWIQG